MRVDVRVRHHARKWRAAGRWHEGTLRYGAGVAKKTRCSRGGGGEQAAAGKGLIPLGEVEIGRDDRRRQLVVLGDQFVEVLIGVRPKLSMINNGTREGRQLALEDAGGAGRREAARRDIFDYIELFYNRSAAMVTLMDWLR